MINNLTPCRGRARLIMTTLLFGAMHGALANSSGATACDVHAAAMVAEMRASAKTPMSEQEVALVRETARKSCIAQNGGTPTPAVVATPAPAASVSVAPAPAPAAKAKSDNSFFGTLGAIFSGPTDRKPGNQRLLDRSQH